MLYATLGNRSMENHIIIIMIACFCKLLILFCFTLFPWCPACPGRERWEGRGGEGRGGVGGWGELNFPCNILLSSLLTDVFSFFL